MTKKIWRWDVVVNLLKNRPHKVGAEIGVWKGHFISQLLNKLPRIEKYYAIDPWEFYEDYKNSLNPDGNFLKNDMKDVFSEYEKSIKGFESKVVTLKMSSEEASNVILDNSLDFIFIDGNHEYNYVKPDILRWLPKVKPGGLISGHDYGQEPGVKKAVDEIFDSIDIGHNYVWWKFINE